MDTKSKLLEAASVLARTEGCGGLAIERIASAAGVSKGAFLYHFPSKRILLEKLIDHVLQGLYALDQDLQGHSKASRNSEISEQGSALQSTLDLVLTLGCLTAVDPTLKTDVRQKITAILDSGTVEPLEVAAISHSQCLLLLEALCANRQAPVPAEVEPPARSRRRE